MDERLTVATWNPIEGAELQLHGDADEDVERDVPCLLAFLQRLLQPVAEAVAAPWGFLKEMQGNEQ